MATRTRRKVASLKDLPTLIERQDGFDEVLAALRHGDSGTIDGTWGSSCALTAATLARCAPGTVLIVLPRLSDVDDFAGDLAGFLGETPLVFPAWETVSAESSAADRVLGARMRVLQELASPKPPRVVVAPIAALLQPVPARAEIDAGTRRVGCGETLDPDEFLRWLLARGFERTTKVELPGECSMHGGILDLFPADAGDPVRIELFGDEVESIRRFDVQSQRKLEELTELAIVIPPGNTSDKGGVHLADHLPQQTWLVLVELTELADEGRQYLTRLNDPRGFFSVDACLARCTERPSVSLASLAPDSLDTNCHLKIQSIERFSGRGAEALVELASVVGLDERALVVCHNAGEKQRLGELLAETELGRNARVELCEGQLAKGFRIVSEKLVVLSDHELFGRTEVRRAPRRRSVETRAIDSFLELNEGELIVHLTHGIGRYRGMQIVDKGDHVEEHLALEFRDGVRVLVPAALIHLVQKYVGGTKGEPILSKLGGTAWERKKRQVADALRDLASDMLRLQAEREAKPGIACATDTHWQMEFEEAFPYTETDDQLRSIEEVKDDMQRARPMDRLICGDVGYGKTEIAMRAAFKAIDNGRQVAVLVPTTVLAEQHFRSFQERMAEYPFTIEVLSRFRTKAEQNKVIKSLKSGGVDLVIGTHRLVQSDIEFKDLGLVVV
ncbi:MAG TPA: DEAD/DEAH box helicase, partial [Planctomycetaceae bacterium]|nr:DEAD/DEAH box helicase [Planctomycetaceae bacterium]